MILSASPIIAQPAGGVTVVFAAIYDHLSARQDLRSEKERLITGRHGRDRAPRAVGILTLFVGRQLVPLRRAVILDKNRAVRELMGSPGAVLERQFSSHISQGAGH